MATIAKGMITLVNVNDAYSVSVTPNVCAIKADFDGLNPALDDAYCDITILCGDVKVPFNISSVISSNPGIEYNISGTEATKRLTITSIPTDVLSGTLTAELTTQDEFVASVVFQYSVMREATMLDWIRDWESNKTTIGSTYLITPKLFVGKRIESEEDLLVLTGVYIGPDSDNGAGIYGLKDGVDIFHVNEYGGMIGGWEITRNGIQIETNQGTLKILSEGSIISDSNGDIKWGLYESGEAVFAKGNVLFHSDGSAEFSGKIISSEGEIGGWYIGEHALCSAAVCLDPLNNYIGIKASTNDRSAQPPGYDDASVHYTNVMAYGGVFMYCNDNENYGLVGYLPKNGTSTRMVFSIGSHNLIAGWRFDEEAIWTGTKHIDIGEYTDSEESITLGTNGLRGHQWRLENDGSGALAGGQITWDAEGSLMVGNWLLDQGVIKSSISNTKYISLDATSQTIKLFNNNITTCVEALDCGNLPSVSKGGYSSSITLSAETGLIQASSVMAMGTLLPQAYISPYGVYANYAGIVGQSFDDGHGHYAAVAGIGNGQKSAIAWNEDGIENCVAGIYGRAHNSGTAPAYGGYFENLKAAGLVLSKRVITDTTTNMQININDTIIACHATTSKTIVLPANNIDGKVIIVQQFGVGTLRVTVNASSGHILGMPSVGDVYTLSQYECAVLIMSAYQENNSVKYVWSINKFTTSAWGN